MATSTYKTICESVFDEVNGRPTVLASVELGTDTSGDYYLTDPTQRNVVRWVNELYLRQQQRCLQWDFMHKRGVFITTKAGTEVYTKSRVREVKEGSLYAVLDGTTGRTPCNLSDYDSWVERERRGEVAGGAPLEIIRRPDEKWIIHPTPTAVWTIYADWWVEPAAFTEACEETLWKSTYDDLLKWQAISLFAKEFAGEGVGPILEARVAQFLPEIKSAFARRYSSSIVGPGAML